MRLIDADELRKRIAIDCEFITVCNDEVLTCIDFDYSIEMSPTVKAIPIEYIEKFKNEFRAVASVKAVIDWLLEKWEKENADTD